MATKRILTVAAHPDDEILGPGATLAFLIETGAEVRSVILGEGETSRGFSEKTAQYIKDLRDSAQRAARLIGVQRVAHFDIKDQHFDTEPFLKITQIIEGEINDFSPDVVMTHHAGDLNLDHRLTSLAVLTATRPTGRNVPDVYAFEVRSSTDWAEGLPLEPFRPNLWQPLEDVHVDKKLSALREYQQEMRTWPHSRSIEAVESQLRHRGSQIGVSAAEAFQLIRCVRGFKAD